MIPTRWGAVLRLSPQQDGVGALEQAVVAAKHLFGVDAGGITLRRRRGQTPARSSGVAGHLHTHVARFTPSG
jgi:hypothetical protein